MFDLQNKNKIILIVVAAFLIVVGILFCLSISIGTKAASIVLSIAIIMGGLVPIIRSLANKSSLATASALLGGAVIALGVFSIIYDIAAILLAILPFLLLVLGVFSLSEAFLMLFARGERNRPLFITEIIIGIVSITLGILMLSISAVSSASGIIFGIVVLFSGVYALIVALVVKSGDEE